MQSPQHHNHRFARRLLDKMDNLLPLQWRAGAENPYHRNWGYDRYQIATRGYLDPKSLFTFASNLFPTLTRIPHAKEYWRENIPPLSSDDAQFWLHQTGLDEAESTEHLHAIREAAYQAVQEFTIARWWFLKNIMAQNPYYNDLLAKIRQGSTIIDVGCGFGQDLRRLRADGATGKLYGVDTRPELWDLGQQLFGEPNDRKCFREIDITSYWKWQPGNTLADIEDEPCVFLLNDVVSFWGIERMTDVFDALLGASKVGTMVFGWLVGQEGNEEKVGITKIQGTRSPLSRGVIPTLDYFESLLGERLNSVDGTTQWNIQAQMLDFETMGFDEEDQEWFRSDFWSHGNAVKDWSFAPDERPSELKALCFMATRIK